MTVANVYNLDDYNYAVADYNITNTLSVAGMYELPFARRRSGTAAGR